MSACPEFKWSEIFVYLMYTTALLIQLIFKDFCFPRFDSQPRLFLLQCVSALVLSGLQIRYEEIQLKERIYL